MDIQNFLTATQKELEELTGIQRSRWSLYFNNRKSMSEQTIRLIARKLEMQPSEVITALDLRRKNHVDNRRKNSKLIKS